ncbi:MAG: ABC transporter ATP-binding protein/permease [Gemmatimonadetes bacterium]|nr:ABC transporter ATP-binding protein/permease [Gemmatimonadota bacterium]
MRGALRYLRPYRGALALVLVLSLVSTAFTLLQPMLSRLLVDRALLGKDVRALALIIGGFLALTAASFVLSIVSGLRYTRVSAAMLFDMRRDVFRHLQRLSPRWFVRTPLGQIAARVNSDIAEIQRVVSELALAWVGQVVYLVGSVVLLVFLDRTLFLVALACVPPAVWATVRYRRQLEGQVARVRAESAQVGTWLLDALMGMRLLVSHNAQARAELDFARRNGTFVHALMDMKRVSYLAGGLPGVILAMGAAVVFFTGGWRVIHGSMSLGTLVAFAAYQMRLMAPIQGLMGLYTSVATARVSWARVREILDAPVDVVEAAHPVALPRAQGALALEGVHCATDRAPVLTDVTLHIGAGEQVAVVGPSGIGKSTLADLLARHADPAAGTVRLDGHDLRTLSLADVRRQVLVVEGEPYVFHATLAENLRMAAPEASDADLEHALDAVMLGAWRRALPQQLQTVLGERGRAMSTGERQRLALARAVLADPRVLVIDEATGALDAATEEALFASLASWLAARTVVCITHRAAVAERFPRVVALTGTSLVDVSSAHPSRAHGAQPAGVA